MTLAQRVKDSRYAKGWGPDELASRAEISRTALYQIESGRTEQPRAGTIRRIAQALSVPTESLLGQSLANLSMNIDRNQAGISGRQPRLRGLTENRDEGDPILLTPVSQPSLAHSANWTLSHRELDIERKFVEILRSPLGEGLSRIVEETYRLLPDQPDRTR